MFLLLFGCSCEKFLLSTVLNADGEDKDVVMVLLTKADFRDAYWYV